MAAKNGLKAVLVDDDETLVLDVGRLRHPDIEFSSIAGVEAGASKHSMRAYDVVVIDMDVPRAEILLADLCGRADAPPVIALAGGGAKGASPERILILAELHGAALALPKPIDADELAEAVLDVLRPMPRAKGIARERGRRAAP